MSLSTLDIVSIAQARLSSRGSEAGLYSPLVRAKLPEAINVLAGALSSTPRRRLLQKTFEFAIDTPTQTADLDLDGVSAAEPLFLPFDSTGSYIGFASVQVNGVDLKPVADRHTLFKLRMNDGRSYYTVQERTMFFNSTDPLSGNVEVVGSFVPVITQTLVGGEVTAEEVDLPTELQDEIVEVLTGLFATAPNPSQGSTNDQTAQ